MRLTREIAECDYLHVNAAETRSPPFKPSPADPTIEVAERQLAMLGELAQMAMVVSRAYAASAVAAAHAIEVIPTDEYWQPETGRARALAGSRDAADAFQKVSRSLRLTLVLEKIVAEGLRDLRAGIIAKLYSDARREDAGETLVIARTTGDGPRPV